MLFPVRVQRLESAHSRELDNRVFSNARPIAPPFLQALDDFAKLGIIRMLVVVSQALFGVAAGASDGEVFELVSAAMVLGNDMLQRRPVYGRAVCAEGELSLTVDTLAFQHLLSVELPVLEGPVGRGDLAESSLLSS